MNARDELMDRSKVGGRTATCADPAVDDRPALRVPYAFVAMYFHLSSHGPSSPGKRDLCDVASFGHTVHLVGNRLVRASSIKRT